jgi:hypothetical protein
MGRNPYDVTAPPRQLRAWTRVHQQCEDSRLRLCQLASALTDPASPHFLEARQHLDEERKTYAALAAREKRLRFDTVGLRMRLLLGLVDGAVALLAVALLLRTGQPLLAGRWRHEGPAVAPAPIADWWRVCGAFVLVGALGAAITVVLGGIAVEEKMWVGYDSFHRLGAVGDAGAHRRGEGAGGRVPRSLTPVAVQRLGGPADAPVTMVRNDVARRVVLVVAALVFVAVAVGTLIAPQVMASQYRLRLDHVDAFNEYRAVYVGLWLAQAALLVFAARHVGWALLGDLGAVLILGQVAGRLISLALDGVPSAQVWPTFVAEVIGGVALLLVRPRTRLTPPLQT